MAHPLPPLRTLEAFEAAFRLQSYSRAGDELGVTHGAISHRIRELEALCGRTLFRRSGNEMIPTDEARALVVPVRDALSILRHTFPAPDKRAIRVSVLPSFASRWLVPRLGAFRKAHPQIGIELDARLDHAEIGPGGVDGAIRYGSGTWPDLRAERIASERLTAVCTPDYRSRHHLSQPADLGRCTLLRNAWQPWLPWLRAAGLDLPEPQTGPRYADAGLLIEAAAAGEGVALARTLLAAPDLDAGRLIRLWDVEIEDSFAYFLVRAPERAANDRSIDAFRDWLVSDLGVRCSAERSSHPPAHDGRRGVR